MFLGKYLRALSVLMLVVCSVNQSAFSVAKLYSGATGGNWNVAGNWSPSGVPTIADDVTIPDAKNVTINTAAVCNSFVFGSGGTNTTITISGSNSLTVVNAFTFQAITTNTRTHTFAIGAGTLSCGSISMASTTANSRVLEFTISTGILDVNGNITNGSVQPRNRIVASGAATFRLAGNFTLGGALINPGTTSTFEFDGTTNQTIETSTQLLFTNTNYPNVVIKGTGLKTLEANTPILAGRSVTIDADAVLNASTFQMTASGATVTFNINGTFITNDADGFSGSATTAINSNNTTINLGANSTIEYNLNGAQTVTARTYSHLKIRNGNTKSLAAGTTTLTGNLGIASGSTLAIAANTINITGSVFDTGTLTISTGVISVSSDLIVSGTFNLTGVSGAKTFNNVSITGTINNSGNCSVSINGNLNNSGTYTVGTGTLTFGGTGVDTISGSSTTTFNNVVLNKGNNFTDHILDVQSEIALNASRSFTMTNGTLKISSASTLVLYNNTEISAYPGIINTTSGLWLNHPSAVITHNANFSVAGLFRLSDGTINIGDANDERYRSMASTMIIEGGNLNVSGRISRPDAAPNNVNFTMTGGTITVGTVGNTDATYPPFGVTETGSIFNMSGGTIIIRQAGGAGLGIGINNSTNTVTGGTIQIGTGSSPGTAQTIKVNSASPLFNLNVVNANATAELSQALNVLGDINISAGTLNSNNFNISIEGNWINNGNFTPGTATVTFTGSNSQSITDPSSETFNNLTVNKSSSNLILNNSITINNALTLTSGNIGINGNTLNLAGTIAGSGKLVGSNTSSINITGTGALGTLNIDNSSRANKTFQNFTINRTSSGTVNIGSDSLRIRSVLTITNGTINTNGRLILSSNASGTARLASISCSPCGTNGDVVVERYIPGGNNKRKWRFLSSPVNVSNAIAFNQLIDDTWVTGSGGSSNGFDECSTCQPSLRTYNEAATGGANTGWTNPSSINSSITTGNGFELFVRGNRELSDPFLIQTEPNDVILDYIGDLNKGPYTVNLGFTNNGVPTADGFNLIGNPYASVIDWDASSGWTKTNVQNKIWAYNPNTALYGVYDADLNIGTNGVTSFIPSGQGFFVKASNAGASVSFAESVKTSSDGFDYFKGKASTDYQVVKLILSKDSIMSDDLFIVFDSIANKNGLDEKDAYKFFNDDLNFYSKSEENYNLSINYHPHTTITDTINLSLFSYNGNDTAVGEYVISKEFFNRIDLKYRFVLKDFYTNTEHDFRDFESYAFNIDKNPKSMGNNRFKIFVKYDPVVQNIELLGSKDFILYPNPTDGSFFILSQDIDEIQSISLINSLGIEQSIQKLEKYEKTFKMETEMIPAGIYFLRLKLSENKFIYKKLQVSR